ncbi:glycosyltransferase [Alteromonas sp. H39]|uniref:glycosyltransferase n=1 Tax=Alteromonas sp. H39 TaxID=3389876 RepID=UPI0039E0D868
MMNKRILHLEFGRHFYGGAKQLEYLVTAENSEHATEHHIACPEGSDLARQLKGAKCKVHPLSYDREIDALVVQRLTTLIDDITPDLIHIHSRHGADVWGAIASRLTGVPAIYTRRTDDNESALSKLKYSQFKAVVSVSEGVKKVVSKRCPDDVLQPVIYPAIDTGEFTFSLDRDWLNKTFSVPDDHKVIANISQLTERKGQGDLILAMRNVLEASDKVTCLIFGEGPQKENYQSMIDRYDLNDHVKLCGFSDNVPRILPNIDVLVHPAYSEGLGSILLQAGATKRMVIACPCGGISEIIKHNETGIHVDVGSPDALGEQIIRALEKSERSEQFGQKLFEWVRDNFNVAEMAKAYDDLYTQVIHDEQNNKEETSSEA